MAKMHEMDDSFYDTKKVGRNHILPIFAVVMLWYAKCTFVIVAVHNKYFLARKISMTISNSSQKLFICEEDSIVKLSFFSSAEPGRQPIGVSLSPLGSA